MFFIQRKWIPHESPINMLCGYKDTETVQLYGNIFVWNINWRGIRADFINSRESKEYCDWYDISTGTRGKWRTHLYDDAHIPVLGVNEFLIDGMAIHAAITGNSKGKEISCRSKRDTMRGVSFLLKRSKY